MHARRTFEGLGTDTVVAYSIDGGRLAIAGGEGRARIVDVRSKAVITQIEVAGKSAGRTIRWHAFSPDGCSYAVSCQRGIFVYDVGTGDRRARIRVGRGEGASSVPFAITPDGEMLYVPDGDGLRAFDLNGRARGRIVVDGAGDCSDLAMMPDGRLLYAGTVASVRDRLIVIDPDADAGRDVERIVMPSAVRPCALTDGTILLFCEAFGVIRLGADLAEIERRSWADMRLPHAFKPAQCQASADGRWLGFNTETPNANVLRDSRMDLPPRMWLALYRWSTGERTGQPRWGAEGYCFRADGGQFAGLDANDAGDPNVRMFKL
ncbi:MAG: hypothetical protein ACI9U2_001453 [Bradymonadia bacterium]|jgi:hypothetical protein